MKRLLSIIKYDILFQFRQGFYLAYGFVTLFYLVVLLTVSKNIAEAIFPFILFTDISILGFFFVGGILLLERGQNTLEAIFATPLTVSEYLTSKIISLSIIATLATVVLFLAVKKEFTFLPVLLLLVWSNMFLYTLMGIGLASKVKTVNNYFVMGIPVGLLLFLPLLTYFNIIKFELIYFLPTEPTLEMLTGKFSMKAIIILIVWMIISWFIGYSFFVKNIVKRRG